LENVVILKDLQNALKDSRTTGPFSDVASRGAAPSGAEGEKRTALAAISLAGIYSLFYHCVQRAGWKRGVRVFYDLSF
jgi:hypothetical protein